MVREFNQGFRHPTGSTPYKVTVSVPMADIPPEGFPVLYVLDGNAYGTMSREMLKLQWRRSDKTQVDATVIVSIGYETTEVFPSTRVLDFTPPASAVSLPPKPDGTPWPAHGGAEEFLHFIEKEVLPFVFKSASINADRQTLFGHSLGGLFVLYTLFNRPDLFQNYISCSPSIWWNECQILKEEQRKCLPDGKNLFIAAEKGDKQNMYDNALHLYERLRTDSPSIMFRSPEGENHMSIVPAILSEAIRFFHGK
ncbi:alpha/beta hydrolase [Sporosarcina sp. Te-1]|uniref:alpha/beta hydrolase n=1 Tax=Sporosarcina sp. Te-1 TaxID=2818390 RepID=UPI001A9EB5CE|nr:alpha/beta hydrolase-fold protein [Sporosarcina sp. Te-1]QTD41852.1 alpha/beta hydrolase [Sporosarcina sp. Te-1]